MRIVTALLFPLLVSVLPLVLVMSLNRSGFVRRSFELSLVVFLVSVSIGFATPMYAVMTCAQSLSEGMAANQPKCVTGAVVFFPIGIIMTVVTAIAGVLYCIRSYKLTYSSGKSALD